MGKISTKSSRDKSRHVPLYRDIAAEKGNLKIGKQNRRKAKKMSKKDIPAALSNANEVVLDASSSRKILQLAREQQEEIAEEEKKDLVATKPRFGGNASEDEEEEDAFDVDNADNDITSGEEEQEEVEYVDEGDTKLFDSYFNNQSESSSQIPGSFNLADRIMEKIKEKEMADSGKMDEGSDEDQEEDYEEEGVMLPPRVIEAYKRVGESLSEWTHGKLPKLFKVLPTLKNWVDILYVTNPEQWTPNAVYEGTRLFVSNLPANQAQKYVNMVLYPRFRQDIEESEDHKLNYHIYMSLKKLLYKPAAFFKGFLFPLVEEQCTAREAMIVASVLKKCSIPVQHSAVALSWLLQREFSPQATVFIRVLIEKKYALPYQTIDDLVFYFMRFRVITDQTKNDTMMDGDETYESSESKKLKEAPKLPLVWHKAFLAFAQRYKNDITDDQRDFLMEVIRQRGHKDIGPEIRRELLAGKRREEKQQRNAAEDDDIMSYF